MLELAKRKADQIKFRIVIVYDNRNYSLLSVGLDLFVLVLSGN